MLEYETMTRSDLRLHLIVSTNRRVRRYTRLPQLRKVPLPMADYAFCGEREWRRPDVIARMLGRVYKENVGDQRRSQRSGTSGGGENPVPGRLTNGKFVSEPIRVDSGTAGAKDGDLEIVFHGVEQSGPSYEARVFLNNPDADARTPLTPEHGYAGSFHVYGYGMWSGEDSSSSTPQRSRAPMERSLIASEAIRRALAAGPDVTVTVVAVKPGKEPREIEPGFRLDGVSIRPHKR